MPDFWLAARYYYTGLACADEAFTCRESSDSEPYGPPIYLQESRLGYTRQSVLAIAIGNLWAAKELETSEHRYQFSYDRLIALVEQQHSAAFPAFPIRAFRHTFTDIGGIARSRISFQGSAVDEGFTLSPRAQSLAVQSLTKLTELMNFQDAKGVGHVEWSLRES